MVEVQSTLSWRGMPVSCPPIRHLSVLPVFPILSHKEPEADHAATCLMGRLTPVCCTHSLSSAPGRTPSCPISPTVSPCLFFGPLFLSTLLHQLPLGFVPDPSPVFSSYGNFYGFTLQINLISVFKAQLFLLRSRICQSRSLWNIFIYLKKPCAPLSFSLHLFSHLLLFLACPYSNNFQNPSSPPSLIFICP